MTLQSVPFFTETIKITEVLEATHVDDFNLSGKTLAAIGPRLNGCRLHDVLGTNDYLVKFPDNSFIHFDNRKVGENHANN